MAGNSTRKECLHKVASSYPVGLGPPASNLCPSSVQTLPQDPAADSHSPSLAPHTRDSGYNTEVSPATTASPANAPRQHFVFDNMCQGPEHEPIAATHTLPLSTFSAPRSPHARLVDDLCDVRGRQRNPSRLRLSPEIFKISEQRSSASPKPVSETSDTQGVVFDFDESDIDEDLQERSGIKTRKAVPSGNLPDGGELDENLLYNSEGILRHWGQSPDFASRYRASSFCVNPRRRHCSTGDDAGLVEAAGWSAAGAGESVLTQRSSSFSESLSQLRRINLDGGEAGGLQRASRFSPLASSQGFQYSCHDNSVSRSESCDSENIFTFDPDLIEDDQDEGEGQIEVTPVVSPRLPIFRDKPPISPASTSRLRRRRMGGSSSFLMRIPCSGTMSGVSVATQTPHVTSTLIHQALSSPMALPNEAIGPAAGSLRRRSSDCGALHAFPCAPLPDIVPTTGRDRSNSVPDFNAYERAVRETGRQVGRELRRMSDDFNSSFNGVRRLSPVSEDLNGYSASFPVTRRPLHFFKQVYSFVHGCVVRPSDSSVDLVEPEDPGDRTPD